MIFVCEIWAFFTVQNVYCASQVRLPKPPAKPAQQKGKKLEAEEPACQNKMGMGAAGTRLLGEGEQSTRNRRRPRAEPQQVRIWALQQLQISLLICSMSRSWGGRGGARLEKSQGLCHKPRSWQVLAGFQNSKQEPESLVAQGISGRRAVPSWPQTWCFQVPDQYLG